MQVLLLVLAIAAPDGAAQLQRARRLIEDEVEFAKGRETLERLLQDKALAPAMRAKALELLGLAQIALRDPQAVDSYLALLALRPGYRPDPLASPYVHKAFTKALRQHQARAPQLQAVKAAPEAAAIRIEGRLNDPQSLVGELKLYTRMGSALEFEPQALQVNLGAFSKRLKRPASGGRLEFFVEGRTPADHPIVSAGDREKPLSIAIEPTLRVAETAWYQRWWVWTSVAVVVAAGIGAVIWAVQPQDPQLPDDTLGVIPVGLVGLAGLAGR